MYDKMPYFNGRVLFNGIAISYLFMTCGTKIWIAGIIGTLIGIVLLLLFKNNNKISKIISAFFMALIPLIILVNIGHSLYLKNTPIWILTIIPTIAVAIISNTKSEALNKVITILFIYSIFLFILELMGLVSSIEMSNLLPASDTSIKDILWASFVFAITLVTPIITLNETTDKKTTIIYCLVSSITIQVICFLAMTILGQKETLLLRFPETVVLKRIEFLNFISSVDAFFNFAVIVDVILTMSISFKNIEESTNKIVKYMLLMVITLITIWGCYNYWPLLYVYNYFPFILIFLLILSIIPIKRKYKVN